MPQHATVPNLDGRATFYRLLSSEPGTGPALRAPGLILFRTQSGTGLARRHLRTCPGPFWLVNKVGWFGNPEIVQAHEPLRFVDFTIEVATTGLSARAPGICLHFRG